MSTTQITDTTPISDTGPIGLFAGQMRRMGVSARQLGRLGESYAAAWLSAHGWRLLDRNWQTRYGELDLVMTTPADVLVFVEVKTRRSTRYGPGQESVTAHKRQAIRHASAQWLLDPTHRRIRYASSRFDVVSLLVRHDDGIRVNHIEGAF